MRKGKICPFECRVSRIARRNKKAFLNRMGKTRDLFKKIRDTKGTFHADGLDKGQKCYGPNRSRRY